MEISFDLLLLPFLGGYIFVRFWNYSRIFILRADKDRIYIRSALAGAFALIFSYAVTIIVPYRKMCSPEAWCFFEFWEKSVPFNGSGVAFLSFLIASLGWIPLNWFCPINKAVDRAILEDGDPFELLLKDSKDRSTSIAVTMKSGKVYVGIVTHIFNPAVLTRNIALLPLRSGFRRPENSRLELTINYSELLDSWTAELDILGPAIDELETRRIHLLNTGGPAAITDVVKDLSALIHQWNELQSKIDSFELVLPVAEIASAFRFNSDIFDSYFRARLDDNLFFELE